MALIESNEVVERAADGKSAATEASLGATDRPDTHEADSTVVEVAGGLGRIVRPSTPGLLQTS